MDKHLFDALEEGLAALETGSDLESVLAGYPDQQDELLALLDAAQAARELAQPEIPAAAQHRSRTRVLNRAAELRSAAKPHWRPWQRLPKLAVAALLVLVILLSGSGLIVASARTLPGDAIYPIKRVVESIQLGLTFDPATHDQIESQFQERRLEEVEQLLDLNRTELVSFYGEVNQQNPDVWVIDGLEVLITPETLIIGKIKLGDLVEVEGLTLPSGQVQVSELHLQRFEISGLVESIAPDIWLIAGQEIRIETHSVVDSDIQIGDYVSAMVRSDDFGTLYAIEIVLAAAPSPAPTETPAPLPTTVETPDEKTLESEADETEEVEKEDQEDSGDADEIDETDEAEGSGESDEADELDETPEPEETDEPDEIDEPEETDEPDETSEPDETHEPAEMDEPKETDEPED